MKIIGLSILLIYMFASCSDEKIEITNEYIINENWSKKNEQAGANSIKINKMKLKKDSTINPFSDLSQGEIFNRLDEDSLFRLFANVKINEGDTYKNKKIYFNRDNGFTWFDDVTGVRTRIIDNLKKDQWYKFSHLVTYPYYVYVYIDSANKAHRFNVNLANY